MQIIPVFDMRNQIVFNHHRSGWAYAIKSLSPLHINGGIRFEGFLDGILKFNSIVEPFVGFFHNPIITPANAGTKYQFRKSLYTIFNSSLWRESEPHCMGLYVLAQHLKESIGDFTNILCESLVHPIEMCDKKFSYDKYLVSNRVLHLGQWMRRYDSFYRLKCKQKKMVLIIDNTDGFDFTPVPSDIDVVSWIPNQHFDEILSDSIVFCHFFDVVACNTILDCIARYTPIVVNRLPGTEEYLGKDYPMFFDNLHEASHKMADDALVLNTHEYLKNLDKTQFSGEYFLNSLATSKIYKQQLNRRHLLL